MGIGLCHERMGSIEGKEPKAMVVTIHNIQD